MKLIEVLLTFVLARSVKSIWNRGEISVQLLAIENDDLLRRYNIVNDKKQMMSCSKSTEWEAVIKN